MKKIMSVIVILAVSISVFSALNGYAADKKNFSTTPITNKGKKWRFGYYEGGSFVGYQIYLKAVVNGFIFLGWIEPAPIPDMKDPQDTKSLWTWMAKNLNSQYIEFVEDAHFSSEWDVVQRQKNKAAVIQRMNQKKDIDYILALGTDAGLDLANNEHSTPVEVIAVANPVSLGIVKSIDDSGYDHVHTKVEPTAYEDQIRFFHDMFHFSSLGIVYEDSKKGRGFAAVDQIEKIAKERGFRIIPCFAQDAGLSEQEAVNNVIECHKILAPRVDAVYITSGNRGVTPNNMIPILAPLIERKIPTFSQAGAVLVKAGILLMMSVTEKYEGRFYAESIAKVLNGAKPREVSQVLNYNGPPIVSINLDTAQAIGYDLPVELLSITDEIFQSIEKSK